MSKNNKGKPLYNVVQIGDTWFLKKKARIDLLHPIRFKTHQGYTYAYISLPKLILMPTKYAGKKAKIYVRIETKKQKKKKRMPQLAPTPITEGKAFERFYGTTKEKVEA